MKTFKLYMLRHGLTDANKEGLYLGHSDVPLSDEGREKLKKLKETEIYPQVSFVFSSPLERATETAKILFPEKEPAIVPELIEYDFGEFEGRGAKELFERAPLFERWLRGESGVRPPFGESSEEFAGRVCSCFVKLVDGLIKEKIDDAMIVTHGGVIGTILANCALPEAKVHEWNAEPGCGYELTVRPEVWLTHRKAEVTAQIPEKKGSEGNYYDGWDYYPEEDDYDITRDVYEDFDPLKEGRI